MSALPPVLDRRRRPAFARLVVNGLFQAGAIIGAMILVRHAFDVMLNPAFDDPECCAWSSGSTPSASGRVTFTASA
jgi:hypothetical protein